ncbi:hypothetical protein HG535_0F00180 [Zygotorulaspora mrakii]|uniref:poly(A)-specific ribonuclease n=1 Tax=Zygotorulaspora mrakii TaxID=42260 RepID=A0A7H9B497_ZYGMR|nr:uncharacterized protein HG535_0F00180 [Zygotorulaspora mrakii]QLG73508.1 hypothetical protein HG535_0F00180 [Zygotorulaspora mrakii]
MQPINMQAHMFPMGDQFFTHHPPNEQQPGMGMNGPQVFSPQLNQARLLSQQPGIVQTTQGMSNPQELQNPYMLKQNMDSQLSQQQASFQHQHQHQPQQQNMSINGPVGISAAAAAANRPPGLNILRQGAPGMNRPGNSHMPKQNLNNAGGASSVVLPPPNHLFIREVWKNNLYAEFATIRKLAMEYNHISVSTEFVGTIARPIGNFRSKTDYHYQTMRSNVDFLNPIQIGVSMCDANGNKPEDGPSTWQFNFHFDEGQEMMSSESFELLQKSGINFDNHLNNGIDMFEFSQLMIDSGLLMDDSITWITYHAAYDFGFLVNILTNNCMPNNREDFEWWVHRFLPNFYDLNLICKVIQDFRQQQQQQQPQQQQPQQQPQQFTLASLAEDLGISRFPLFTTTAGQSLLTSLGFFQLSKLSMNKLPNGTTFETYRNLIYGINGE